MRSQFLISHLLLPAQFYLGFLNYEYFRKGKRLQDFLSTCQEIFRTKGVYILWQLVKQCKKRESISFFQKYSDSEVAISKLKSNPQLPAFVFNKSNCSLPLTSLLGKQKNIRQGSKNPASITFLLIFEDVLSHHSFHSTSLCTVPPPLPSLAMLSG